MHYTQINRNWNLQAGEPSTLYQGAALAILRASETKGPATLTVSADGLGQTTLTIMTE